MSQLRGRQIRTFALICATSVSLWLTLVSFASAEVINNFAVDIKVQANGDLSVTETIVYDFGEADRHGIFRDLKETHPQSATSWFKDRYVTYDLQSVQRDGASEPYQVESSDGLFLRIGDPDITISGQHTYSIIYEIVGAIASYETGDEIYWNVTGNEWSVPINNISVTIQATDGVSLLPEQTCYVGLYGSTENCEVSISDTEAQFIHASITPGEGITVAQRVALSQEPVVLERFNLVLLWVIAGGIWAVGLFVWLWRWKFRYKRSSSIVAQYEPYEGFKPMFTGVLFDNRLDNRDITAGLIYLAEQGFIAIKQTEDKVLFLFETNDYEITLKRPVEELDTDFQRQLLSLLDLSVVDQTIKLSALKKDQSKLRENTKVLSKLRNATIDDLIAGGFLEQGLKREVRIVLAVGLSVVFFVIISTSSVFFGVTASALLILICGSLLLWLIMGLERRTGRGYEALDHLKGFKDFLSTTEKDRYEFHNAPERNAEQFMEYLPYAIAFGVEKKWAEVFKDIQIATPDWYSSTNATSFNAAVFTSDMSSFATAFASSTTPAGSSGSGGGGFSGGGGGGGGGGSW